MKLTDLIGKKVSKIRFKHELSSGARQQQFQSQIKLSDGDFILFPTDPSDEIELIQYYDQNKSCAFNEAKRCGLAYRLVFRKKEIVDVHFKFRDGEHSKESNGIIELENGKYLMENPSGLEGSKDANLMVLNKTQFQQLNKDGVQLRSFRKDIMA